MKLSEMNGSAVWGGTATRPNKLHAFLSGARLPAVCSSRIYTTGPLELAKDPQYGNGEVNYCARCVGHLITRANNSEGAE